MLAASAYVDAFAPSSATFPPIPPSTLPKTLPPRKLVAPVFNPSSKSPVSKNLPRPEPKAPAPKAPIADPVPSVDPSNPSIKGSAINNLSKKFYITFTTLFRKPKAQNNIN